MQPPSILVIDDEPSNFEVIEALLFNRNYILHYNSNANEAIESLDLLQPDVILLDVMMPEVNGIQLCQQIKQSEKWRKIPIIIVTALSRKEDLVQCFNAGADDFISKPINGLELRARVNSMLRIKQQYDDLQTSLERQAILEREKAESDLRESENRYSTLANIVPVGIFRTDLQGVCFYVNERWCLMSGLTPEESYGFGWMRVLYSEDSQKLNDIWYRSREVNSPFSLEYRFQQPNGRIIWVLGQSVIERNEQGEVIGYVGTVTDITERKEAQERFIYNSLHDPLTDLPNRTLLMDRLELALRRSKISENYHYAVLFLDLDRFKVINDSLGHLSGDQLLKKIAQKLKNHLKTVDLIARLGGDEFVILLEDISALDEAIKVAERIIQDTQSPLIINDYEIFISTSVGIVLGTPDYTEASDLLRDADIAMYRAKMDGRGTYRLFDHKMHKQAVNRLILETDLRKALENEEFLLYYQPIMNIVKNQLIGFEALVRWQHPIRGLVPPDQFIPITEETGLIVQLTSWVFYKACQQLANWKAKFPAYFPLKMSINLSAKDLRKANLIEDIDKSIAATGLTGDCITLEITESMLIENIHKTIELLNDLKKRNIHLSIDDFGTGYSSLKYLHLFPANYLKIDRSFVSQMLVGNRNYKIVNTIINLSKQLGLEVVAEGIENNQQLQLLHELGCEFGQGFLFSKALCASEIERIYFNRG